MSRYTDWFWPRLEKPSKEEQDLLKKDLAFDKTRIEIAPWTTNIETILEEARRLNDAESERRKTADNKAGIYLAAITALSPVLTSFLPSIWNKDLHAAFSITSLLIFFLATFYLLRAGIWAFETLKVSASNRVDVKDLAKAWEFPDPQTQLARMLLLAVRYNHDGVNRKVTCIKMTHAFLLRSFLTFILLLVVQVAWKPAELAFEWANSSSQKVEPQELPYASGK